MGAGGKEEGKDAAHVEKQHPAGPDAWQREQHEAHLRTIDALTDQLKADREAEGAAEGEKALREKITIGLLVVTVVLTALTYCVFDQQLTEMRRATVSAERDAEKAAEAGHFAAINGLIGAHIDSDNAVKQAALDSNAALDKASDATIRANRAWLQMDAPANHFGSNGLAQTMEITLNVSNIGKEPASEARNHFQYFWLKPVLERGLGGAFSAEMKDQHYPSNDSCNHIDERKGGVGAVWPGKPSVIINGDGAPLHQSFGTLSELIGFQACIRYKTFGVVHHTRVCYLFTPKTLGRQSEWYWSFCQGPGQQEAD